MRHFRTCSLKSDARLRMGILLALCAAERLGRRGQHAEPSPSNTEYYLAIIRIIHMRDQPLSRQHGLRVIPALVAADPQLVWLKRLNTELCAIGHQQRGIKTPSCGAIIPKAPINRMQFDPLRRRDFITLLGG